MTLTKEQFEILDHTIYRTARGYFCGDSPDMRALVSLGMMRAAGSVSWCPDEFFTITDKGKKAHAEYRKLLTTL